MTTTPQDTTSVLSGQPVLRTAYQQSVAAYWNAERDPVNINNSLRLTKLSGNFRVFKEGIHVTVTFGDAECARFPQLPYQKVIVIRKADKNH